MSAVLFDCSRNGSRLQSRFFVCRTQSKFAQQTTTETNFATFGCKPAEPFVVVVHGWTEGCSNTQWVRDTLNNFIIHRKGCILCLDYSVIADGNDYFTVAKLMEPIARTLEKKLRQLFTFGIAPASGMLYGFSLGAHVAFQAGRNLAPQKLGRIDGELVDANANAVTAKS